MWENASAQKCKTLYDDLANLRRAGGIIPDGKTLDDVLHTTTGEILDLCQKVFDDTQLWTALPETYKDRTGRTCTTVRLREHIGQILDESR